MGDVTGEHASDGSAYRLWVNPERTVLVRLWATGTAEVAFRDDRGGVWGPAHELEEERT